MTRLKIEVFVRDVANISDRSFEIFGAILPGTAKLWPFFSFYGAIWGYAFC